MKLIRIVAATPSTKKIRFSSLATGHRHARLGARGPERGGLRPQELAGTGVSHRQHRLRADLDGDVAVTKIFKVFQDRPAVRHRARPCHRHSAVPGLKLTLYVSHNDKGPSRRRCVLRNIARLGLIDATMFTADPDPDDRRPGRGRHHRGAGATDFSDTATSFPIPTSAATSSPCYGTSRRTQTRGRALEQVAGPFWRVRRVDATIGIDRSSSIEEDQERTLQELLRQSSSRCSPAVRPHGATAPIGGLARHPHRCPMTRTRNAQALALTMLLRFDAK